MVGGQMNRIQEGLGEPRLTQTDISLEAWADFVMHIRQHRAATFGSDLFGDPAWDIILLLGREINATGLSLQDISIQLGRSEESSRRWLEILLGRGHLEEPQQHIYRLASRARQGLSEIAAAGAILSF
jgi:hypothetical protein